MALTKVTSDVVDSTIVKYVALTQAAYDALGSYDASTIYITTE